MPTVARLFDHGEFNVQASIDERTPTVCKYNKIRVKAASWGYGNGEVYLNDVLKVQVSRSWCAIRLDQYGEYVDNIAKDVYGYVSEAVDFWKYIESTPNGYTLIIATGDEPQNNSSYFVENLEMLGFTKSRYLGSRSAWVGIVRKGDRVILEEYGPNPTTIDKIVHEPKGFVKFSFDNQMKADNGYGGNLPVAYRKYMLKTNTRSYDTMPIIYPANTPFIFECEFKPEWDCINDKYLLALSSSENEDTPTWNFGIFGNVLGTYNGIVDTSAIITIGNKYHIKLVYDGTNLRVYLDGKLVNTRTVNIAASTQVRIGEFHNLANMTDDWFVGEIWNWKLITNPVLNNGATVSIRGLACEEKTFNLMPNPTSDTKVFYDFDGWEVVHLIDSRVTPGFTDWLTGCFYSGVNQQGVIYTLSFWAKGNILPGWQTDLWGPTITVNWLEAPTPDPNKYQRYVAQVWANSNANTELLRIYYWDGEHSAYLYIANPQLERKYRPAEYTQKITNLVTRSIENYSDWNTNQWWRHGNVSCTVESITNPFGGTSNVFKGINGGSGMYCYPPYSREPFVTSKLYVGSFWGKNTTPGTTGSVWIRNDDSAANLNQSFNFTDEWKKYTYYWYAKSPGEMHTYVVNNAYIYGIVISPMEKDNGTFEIPLNLPSGDFTLFGKKYNSKFESIEKIQVLVKSGSTFKFFENGLETTTYRNKYKVFDAKSVGVGAVSNNHDSYFDFNAYRYMNDPISDFMNLSVDNKGCYYRTWVYCSSDVTFTHRYSADNTGAIRVNYGSQQDLGNWNYQTNPDVSISLKQGWNLIEYTWMDGDSGGGFNLYSTAISQLSQVLYMTAEMPIEFLKNNRIGYNSKSNIITKDIVVFNYALTDSEVKEMSNGNAFKITSQGFLKSVRVKEERSFPLNEAYYFPLGAKEDSSSIAINQDNLVFERGCVYAGQGTFNLFSNPIMENASGWNPSNDGQVHTSSLPDEGLPFFNSGCVRVYSPSWYANAIQYPSLTAGQVYTLSSWLWCPTNINGHIYVWYNNPWQGVGGATVAANEKEKWVRKSFTFTAPSASVYNVSAGFIGGSVGNLYVCRAQIEQKGFASHWANGSRGAGKLSFNLNQNIGLNWSGDWTIIYWKKPIGSRNSGLTDYHLSSLGCNSNTVGGGYMWFGKGSNIDRLEGNFFLGTNEYKAYDVSPNFNANGYFGKWVMVSIKKSGTNISVTEWGIDNIKKRSISWVKTISVSNYFVNQYGYDLFLNGHDNGSESDSYFKDLIVYKSALTDAQLENIYDVRMRIYKDYVKIPFFREYM